MLGEDTLRFNLTLTLPIIIVEKILLKKCGNLLLIIIVKILRFCKVFTDGPTESDKQERFI